MFFGKTKKKNKPTTIEHPVLGTLIKKTDWYTKKYHNIQKKEKENSAFYTTK